MKAESPATIRHTAGPWKVATQDYDGKATITNGAEEICRTTLITSINSLGGWTKEPATTEANGRLIAAAPELLEACKQALFTLNQHVPGEHTALIKAISKATEL